MSAWAAYPPCAESAATISLLWIGLGFGYRACVCVYAYLCLYVFLKYKLQTTLKQKHLNYLREDEFQT